MLFQLLLGLWLNYETCFFFLPTSKAVADFSNVEGIVNAKRKNNIVSNQVVYSLWKYALKSNITTTELWR